ncbi:MAG: MFS transporter [Azospirillaceae bacterium]
MSPVSTYRNLVRVLGHRSYGIYTAGNAVSLIGNWMQRIAVGWATWDLTGSGTWLGVMMFADLAPTLVVAPLAGAVADRWDRMRTMKTIQSLACGLAILLAILFTAGYPNVWLLLAIVTTHGTLFSLGQPTRMVIVSSLVPREDIGAAVAINSITFNLARFIGPAIAGVIIATVGVGWAFAANALTFVAFLVALHHVTEVRSPRRERPSGSLLGSIGPGLRYSIGNPGILAMIVLMIGIGLGARPLVELLPGFADAVFGVGAMGLAILTSSIGAGAIVGGLWLSGRTSTMGLTRISFGGAIGMTVAIVLFVSTANLWVAVPALTFLGFCLVSTAITIQTSIQLAVPDELRGRVLSLYGLFLRGGPAFGALFMGIASDWFGLRISLAAGALLLALVIVWLLGRQHRVVDALENAPERQSAPGD